MAPPPVIAPPQPTQKVLPKNPFGKLLKKRREGGWPRYARGSISIAKLSTASGYSAQMIEDWENGRSIPVDCWDVVHRLAEALSLTPQEESALGFVLYVELVELIASAPSTYTA